jgi:hypothetical protein
MKKLELNKKLNLSKETMSKFEMGRVTGGSVDGPIKFGSSALAQICFCATTLLKCHDSPN